MFAGTCKAISRACLALLATLFATLPLPLASATAQSFLSDDLSHPPPLNGKYPFSPAGTWLPGKTGFLQQGQTYQDPIFRSTIRRLTDDYPSTATENYAKNGFWNADGTRLMYFLPDGHHIIDATTGAVVRANVPGTVEGSFDPIDPDIWYYFSGTSLRQYRISTGATSIVKKFSNTLGRLGGSVDWIDRSGRYMVLKIGNYVRVWDKITDTLFSGSISQNIGGGWIGISPDASYVITTADGGLQRSYAINKVNKTVSTKGTLFWTLCGDHADLLSASDGKTYMVTFNCYDEPAVYRVDVSIPQSASNVQKQKTDNVKLFDTTWNDDGHFSCVAKGIFQDWCFVSTEHGGNINSWWPYKDEIIGVNVLTGEVLRYAHHRSRNMNSGCYYCQPRVQATWDGTKVAFSSNYGATKVNAGEYGDLYVLELGTP